MSPAESLQPLRSPGIAAAWSAAAVTVPHAVGLGLLAFAPLAADHSLAALALWSAALPGLLLTLGVLRLAWVARFLPVSVTHGFAAGVGLSMVVGQVRNGFGAGGDTLWNARTGWHLLAALGVGWWSGGCVCTRRAAQPVCGPAVARLDWCPLDGAGATARVGSGGAGAVDGAGQQPGDTGVQPGAGAGPRSAWQRQSDPAPREPVGRVVRAGRDDSCIHQRIALAHCAGAGGAPPRRSPLACRPHAGRGWDGRLVAALGAHGLPGGGAGAGRAHAGAGSHVVAALRATLAGDLGAELAGGSGGGHLCVAARLRSQGAAPCAARWRTALAPAAARGVGHLALAAHEPGGCV